LAAVVAGVVLTGCARADALPSERDPVNVVPLADTDAPPRGTRIGNLTVMAALELRSAHPMFGGLSGLRVRDGRLVAVSDGGALWQAELLHAADGTLRGATDWKVRPIRARGLEGRLDAEAVERTADGGLVVALEGRNALLHLSDDGSAALEEVVPLPEPLSAAPSNEGVETLVRLPDDSLVALSEGMKGRESELLGLRLHDGAPPQLLRYGATDGFVPTDADRLGSQVFVLERRVSLFGGFEARVVRLDLEDGGFSGRGALRGEEITRLGVGTISENFEGIAAVAADDGRVLLYLLSDDNFSVLQRTLLVQLSLRP
jgi:hypothetical protein